MSINSTPEIKVKEMDKKQIDYVKQFFNVERIIGRGAFGQVLVTSPIQNQPPESANSTSTTTIITTTTTAPADNSLDNAANNQAPYTRFAVKCVLPVIKPHRLASELRYLRDLGGKCNVVQLHTAQLNKGSLYIVMELIDHDRFSKIVPDMSSEEIVLYMKNLLIALQHVHAHNIMHRDIKPANFLYNRQHRKFLLVDFGLASPVRLRQSLGGSDSGVPGNLSSATLTPAAGTGSVPPTTPNRRALNDSVGFSCNTLTTPKSLMGTPKTPTANRHLLGARLFADADHHKPKVIANSPYVDPKHVISPVKRMTFGSPLIANISTKRHLQPNETNDSIQMLKKLRVSNNDETREPVKLTVGAYESPVTANDTSNSVSRSARKQTNPDKDNHRFSTPKVPRHPRCNCRGRPKTCCNCMSRPEPNAPRSGTAGYKAPEILLRYPYQTTSIDIWSAGVILFCLLAGHHPMFRDVDESTSLCEIITLFGSQAIVEAAKQMNVKLILSPERPGNDLKYICQKVRSMSKGAHVAIPDEAFDLLKRMLDPNPFTRITASDALQHPWFNPHQTMDVTFETSQ